MGMYSGCGTKVSDLCLAFLGLDRRLSTSAFARPLGRMIYEPRSIHTAFSTSFIGWRPFSIFCVRLCHPVWMFKPDLHPALRELLRQSSSTIRPLGSEQVVHDRTFPDASSGR